MELLTRNGDSLALQRLNGEDRSVGRVSIVGPASAVEFFGVLGRGVQHRGVGTQALVPSHKRRLFVEVTVKEVSLVDVAFDLDEDDRSEILLEVGDDFRVKALYPCGLNPGVDVVRGLDALGPSDLFPLLGAVEALTHILNFDVVDQ